MADGYGQHYSSMYSGSMVGSGACVFAVMGYVIANTNSRTSCIELNEMLLAAILGETVETVRAAIDKLCEPDPRSRTKLEDGRRLIRQGEFLYYVVNFKHYRGLIARQQKTDYMREYMAKRREIDQANTNLTPPNTTPNKNLTSASASASASAICDLKVKLPKDLLESHCAAIYAEYPHKVGKPHALRAIAKAIIASKDKGGFEYVLERTKAFAKARAGDKSFLPHPSTWFNQERYNDDPDTWSRNDAPPKRTDRNAGTFNAGKTSAYDSAVLR